MAIDGKVQSSAPASHPPCYSSYSAHLKLLVQLNKRPYIASIYDEINKKNVKISLNMHFYRLCTYNHFHTQTAFVASHPPLEEHTVEDPFPSQERP